MSIITGKSLENYIGDLDLVDRQYVESHPDLKRYHLFIRKMIKGKIPISGKDALLRLILIINLLLLHAVHLFDTLCERECIEGWRDVPFGHSQLFREMSKKTKRSYKSFLPLISTVQLIHYSIVAAFIHAPFNYLMVFCTFNKAEYEPLLNVSVGLATCFKWLFFKVMRDGYTTVDSLVWCVVDMSAANGCDPDPSIWRCGPFDRELDLLKEIKLPQVVLFKDRLGPIKTAPMYYDPARSPTAVDWCTCPFDYYCKHHLNSCENDDGLHSPSARWMSALFGYCMCRHGGIPRVPTGIFAQDYYGVYVPGKVPDNGFQFPIPARDPGGFAGKNAIEIFMNKYKGLEIEGPQAYTASFMYYFFGCRIYSYSYNDANSTFPSQICLNDIDRLIDKAGSKRPGFVVKYQERNSDVENADLLAVV